MSGYYFFWKHRLSQWHQVKFTIKDTTYCCCEQYMMQQKALLFGDIETAKRVMETSNPQTHQQLGRNVKNFKQDIWDQHKEEIVYEGNLARFKQSPECRELLMSTKPKILCESSPYDCIWGCGLSKDDPRILDESNWRGQNLLGKILTKIRDEL